MKLDTFMKCPIALHWDGFQMIETNILKAVCYSLWFHLPFNTHFWELVPIRMCNCFVDQNSHLITNILSIDIAPWCQCFSTVSSIQMISFSCRQSTTSSLGIIVLCLEIRTSAPTHSPIHTSSRRAMKVFICSLPSTMTPPYLVHLLFSRCTLGTAIRPREGMPRCMPTPRDSLFLLTVWLMKQWGNRPFPWEGEAWFGWAYRRLVSLLLSTHLLNVHPLFLPCAVFPPTTSVPRSHSVIVAPLASLYKQRWNKMCALSGSWPAEFMCTCWGVSLCGRWSM